MDYSGGGGEGGKGYVGTFSKKGGKGAKGYVGPFSNYWGMPPPPPPSSYAYEINFFSSFSTGENLFVCFLC